MVASTSPVILGPNQFWKEDELRGNSWFIPFLKPSSSQAILYYFPSYSVFSRKDPVQCRHWPKKEKSSWKRQEERKEYFHVCRNCNIWSCIYHGFPNFFKKGVFFPCIQWLCPVLCNKLEQAMFFFLNVITYGSWLESIVQWCRQMKRSSNLKKIHLGGGSCIKINLKWKHYPKQTLGLSLS